MSAAMRERGGRVGRAVGGAVGSVTVDIAALAVSADPDDVLVTYALGSCIAVTVWDPGRRVGGMIHYMLPLSRTSPEKAKRKPAMFADTGVPLLFETMYGHGCRKQDLVVKVAGGAKIHDDEGTFDIGRRNHTILRKLFWKNGVMVAAEDVGGHVSRTVRLDVGTGEVLVRSRGRERPL